MSELRLTEEEIVDCVEASRNQEGVFLARELARRIESAVLRKVADFAASQPCSGTVCCAEAVAREIRAAAEASS